MKKYILPLTLLLSGAFTSEAATDFAFGEWRVNVDDSGYLLMSHRDKEVFKQGYATLTYNIYGETDTRTITTGDVAPVVTETVTDDCFGTGRGLEIAFPKEGAVMTQHINFYDNLPYFIVSVSVASENGATLQSNHMVPLATDQRTNPFNGGDNRFITVPYDNDGHIRFGIDKISDVRRTSHEVTAIFDGTSRLGLVAGSVDHDKWKNGVSASSYATGFGLNGFELLSGLANEETRDVCAHGKVKGEVVTSARFMVGMFDDWREGLDSFADANTAVVPRWEWTGGNPMGWSSWGVMMNYVNYNGVVETARWIDENLRPLGFQRNDGRTVISLDAFAEDNIPAAYMKKLGTKVLGDEPYKDGRETVDGLSMDLGLYCGPFVLWGWVENDIISGTGIGAEPSYTWGQAALRHDGKLIKVNSNGAYAIDPTHPAIRKHIESFMAKYASYGVKYVKVDFLNNGMCEGDSWYDPEITTGVMAYNYGMQILREEAERYGMYVVESIAPMFPYQYAHGRRQCCDRFSEIGESEYVMNAISYGWWTDRLYTVNDPDQLVLCKADHGAAESMGENRARATTGMASGAFIFGDNLSEEGTILKDGQEYGYSAESRRRALEIMGNADINSYVRDNLGSFRPIEGNRPTSVLITTSAQYSESLFMRDTERYLYVAAFNFEKTVFGADKSDRILFDRIGIDPENVKGIKELWTGETVDFDGEGFKYEVPKSDARVYRIEKRSWNGVEAIGDESTPAERLTAFFTTSGNCRVDAGATILSLRAWSVAGALIAQADNINDSNYTFPVSAAEGSVIIIDCTLADGTHLSAKVVK
jgi:alpha-galactosidase